jgi:hypothetical protein
MTASQLAERDRIRLERISRLQAEILDEQAKSGVTNPS